MSLYVHASMKRLLVTLILMLPCLGNGQMSEHAVLVQFSYGSTDLSALFALERRLEAAIDAANAGEYDGNEVAVDGSDGTLYMYGPDAEALYRVARPILEDTNFMRGARVTRRFGPPRDGVREVTTEIGK